MSTVELGRPLSKFPLQQEANKPTLMNPQCVFSWKAQTEAKSKNDGPEAFEIVGSVSDESRRQLTFEDAGRRFLSSLHQEADEVLDRWLSHNVLWVQVADTAG
ncbi:hypothetical protein L914_03935 [Phytophthora nicotianae]|uniref:Uncharacterized protein n=1 Tax=Phytophthora nicotianae TaxID=4792 RepID=W2NWY0_PHYNI|nr:hypothetical protein L914_03935 [Phytophthora nicotianae]